MQIAWCICVVLSAYCIMDKRAFEKFYNEHFDKLYRFVFFRCGRDEALAQDLVSEIFMKALKHFHEYDETKSKSAWLLTIARNHMANYWRDHKATEPLVVFNDEGEKEDDSMWIKGSLEAWQKQDASRTVKEILALLSENEREIVTLHYLLGYSYAEIAEKNNMTEVAVKVAAHRALKKMKPHV